MILLINPKPSKLAKSYKSDFEKKLQMISKWALSIPPGSIDDEPIPPLDPTSDYKLALKIQTLVLQLFHFLKKKEVNAATLKFIFSYGRLILELILRRCGVNLHYTFVISETKQVVIIAIGTVGATGFVLSWFSVGAILFGFPTLLSAFILRSFFQ